MLSMNFDGRSIKLPETEKELKRIGKLWIQRARYRLDNAKPFEAKASGSLRKSMKARVSMENGQPTVDVTPSVSYWIFVDQGVRGSQSSPFPKQKESPFKFSTKMPPRASILDWVKTRGIQFRDKKGRFVTRETTAYLIQRDIFFRGLRPRRFYSDTGEDVMNKYMERVVGAFARDLENATKSDI